MPEITFFEPFAPVGNDADDAEGSVLLQSDAVLATESIGLEELHARGFFAGHDELVHLVFEPAYFGFLELLQAELLSQPWRR